MTDVSVRPLEDAAAFLTRWSALYQSTEYRSFYQSPAWMKAWLESVGGETALHVIEASESGKTLMMGVVGTGPRRPALFGLKEIRLHETGDPALDDIYVEYNDFLAAPEAGPQLRLKMLGALAETFGEADAIVFRNARAPLADAIREWAALNGWDCVSLSMQPVYVIDLRAMREAVGTFLDSLSGSFKTKLRRAMDGYEKRGALACRIATIDAEREGAWDKLVALHQASWRARGKPGVFANEKFVAFHRRLQRETPEAVHLIEVICGDETIGVVYNFVQENRILNYQSGFKLEEDNKLTPGFVCHALACQHYLDEGFDAYDLLAGEADYKKRLGVEAEVLTSLALERPSFRNQCRKAVKDLRRRFS